MDEDIARTLSDLVGDLETELIQIRRDLHAHPEVARTEYRTTAVVAERLEREGLTVHRFEGTGLRCDIDPPDVDATDARRLRRVVLRADLDALPVPETSGLPFASVLPMAHACGHDVHTTAALGAGLALARLARQHRLDSSVRLVFQPAEEVQPGGALDVIAAGALEGYQEVYALHCEPKLDVGLLGSRVGPITSASDTITVTVHSDGGHTSRPHLTGDIVYALGQVITGTPSALGRRIDPRAGVNLTWGAVNAGNAPNAIPTRGTVTGTLRCLDDGAWELAEDLLGQVVRQIVAPYAVGVDVDIVRGVPPVVNDRESVAAIDAAIAAVIGPQAVVPTEQSLGGEDFGWYLLHQRGAMVRLGTRTPAGPTFDLHRGDIVIDERAIGIGARVLAAVAALPPCAARDGAS